MWTGKETYACQRWPCLFHDPILHRLARWLRRRLPPPDAASIPTKFATSCAWSQPNWLDCKSVKSSLSARCEPCSAGSPLRQLRWTKRSLLGCWAKKQPEFCRPRARRRRRFGCVPRRARLGCCVRQQMRRSVCARNRLSRLRGGARMRRQMPRPNCKWPSSRAARWSTKLGPTASES